ncbi:hypothetical protein KIN20_006563 [Parelaphostrongylus tenuis]|uniref:Uncharacterized protein n=1 Tax=Parelaphostrongylus tenuis TaxID=148309 RepID=A0AAD5M1Y9_PARTN|nr:hypothetical protein KIN20_006563 [Parelaphostrongylus tenuis]
MERPWVLVPSGPSRFLPDVGRRKFEEINDLKNISPDSKLKTAQYALERNATAKNAQRKSNYLRDLKYDKFEYSERKVALRD